MSATEYYSHTTYPATGAAGSSASLRSELELVEAGFGKLPDLSGNSSKIVAVNSGGTALEAVAVSGTGDFVRTTNAALVTPNLGTPSALVGTNITGTAANLTAGNVTTNANLTGHVTSTGNAAVLGSFTLAQLNTAVSDAEVARTDGTNTFTGPQRGTLTTDNDGSFDMNATNNFKCTTAGALALTFTNITSGQGGNIIFINASNHAITAAATTKVTSTLLATISVTGTYLLGYFSDGTNVYVVASGALA